MTQRYSVFLTGGTGFIGGAVKRHLASSSRGELRVLLRSRNSLPAKGETPVYVDKREWFRQPLPLSGVDVVIHCAARAHVMQEGEASPLDAYREINTIATIELARQAARAGVKRFIFLSSIKVNGEKTIDHSRFKPTDTPKPEDPYGISKWEAEQGLRDLAMETGMEVVIIRPPLVYGFGVKGNFSSMTKLVAKGLPLPLGAVHNKRSLVALDNLVDLIITCIDHPKAANQTFLVSDGDDLSTTQLLQHVAEGMGAPSRLIPVPASWLQFGATLFGKKAIAQRVLGSLQVDISHTQKCLNWNPPLTVKQGFQRCFIA